MHIDEILENFELLDDWEDRYRYVIELGRTLEPLPEAGHNDVNKVRGCASQVWLESKIRDGADRDPSLDFRGDSDAHIVRGLIAILIALYSDRTSSEILATDAKPILRRMGLAEHLTPQRSNGLAAMAARIQADAEAAQQGALQPSAGSA
jgi:cysteine desulfuration protein SufE